MVFNAIIVVATLIAVIKAQTIVPQVIAGGSTYYYIGCFGDQGAGLHVLTQTSTIGAGVYIEQCGSFCQAGGYKYMGVEDGKSIVFTYFSRLNTTQVMLVSATKDTPLRLEPILV